MVQIPGRFERVAAAFDEAVARGRLCESSGSEHSAASFTDLSDLVNSFLEREMRENVEDDGVVDRETEWKENGIESESKCSASDDEKEVLRSLLMGSKDDDDEDVRLKIHGQVEKGSVEVGGVAAPGFKRRLMARLRERGLEAGLCKSKWDKNGRCPSGVYEYIDVIVDGTRYIIEVGLAGEFKIARPTGCYTALLEVFPAIFVGKAGQLKKIVKVMSNGIRTSMKSMDIHIPPWRRHAYMQAKWFGSYKRTINEVPAAPNADKFSTQAEDSSKMRSVGFSPVPAISYYCREDFKSRDTKKMGNLAAALASSPMLLQ